MDIAQAYVQIIPSTDGIKQNLTTALSDAGTSAGNTAGNRIGGALAAGLKVGGAAIGAAVATGAVAVGSLASQAVSAYGNFEQLSGGVEKLFGADMAKTVQENAQQAFQTAGMSANEYMETVTGFSAALIKSVGGDTAKAANLADLALRDMSDNANVFGSDMESIQNAYAGFSRGNFTMLDNLKLGFAGTKEGMEELLETASGLTGKSYSIDSYADIVEAIHAVQEAQNIAGTTAKEAAGTIQGSLQSTKAAWQNLITGLGTGEDISPLIDNVVTSVSSLIDNVMPVLDKVLEGIGKLFEKIVPIIIEKLPPLIAKITPPLLAATGSLLMALGKSLVEMLPGIGRMLMQGISEVGSWILEQVKSIPRSIIKTLSDFGSSFLEVGKNWLSGVWNGFVERWDDVKNKLGEWGSNVLGFVNHIFGNASPSKKFKKIGSYLMEGLEIGISNSSYLAENALSEVSNSLTGEIGTASMSVGVSPSVAPRGTTIEVPRAGAATGQQSAILMLDKEVLGRVVYTLNQEAVNRVGVNLAGGMA